MKLTHKKIRAIVFFLISTCIGFINSPLAIVVEISFLLWELLEEEEEE
ncbi:MAG TPA: hypothetical protein VK203_25960 [Nostocaceae cyanobacterium]|nr:hypothetical protein [Nostocaceae cyanobacterium]